ncbi:MAG: PspC domain-containing protein [Bacteroidales bacterium]|jgi:phage shock protein PspC (stress-responsive transcriptional regulator)|nr:PspC domain-containing protein [Bacteroidales bacterium]
MKKNININMFGTIYSIDEDACKLLEEYIADIKHRFSQQDGGEEIADDIEHRIAELLWERKEAGVETIDIMTIKTILKQIGQPEQLSENETTSNDAAQNESETDKKEGKEKNKTARKLFRDSQDKKLGGVLSGLRYYFGANDITLIRVLFVVACLTVPLPLGLVYIVMWIITPEAQTARDRLLMKGEEITPDSLEEEIQNEQKRDGETSGKDGEDDNQDKKRKSNRTKKIVLLLIVLAFAMWCTPIASIPFIFHWPLPFVSGTIMFLVFVLLGFLVYKIIKSR